MKEPKAPPPPVLNYIYPPPATPEAALEGPSQAEAAKAGELVVDVHTSGGPISLVIQHNFNLSPGEVAKKMPDVSFEPEDADFYSQKPVISKRAANSITIDLNPGEKLFGPKATAFVIKLKRYYTPPPPPPPAAKP